MAKDSSLTAYVARFIVDTAAGRIPKDVMHLGLPQPIAEKTVDLVFGLLNVRNIRET